MTLLLDAAATYRLTKLVTDDVVTQPLRARVIQAAYMCDGRAEQAARQWGPLDHADAWEDVVKLDDQPPKLATLVTCRWCAGMWLAAGVVLARRLAPRAWQPAAELLALSAAAALLARLEDG